MYLVINRSKYSDSDQAGFKVRFDRLAGKDETDVIGSVRRFTLFNGDLIGHSELRLDSVLGYAEFYYYSCFNEARFLDFGTISETATHIDLIPDFPSGSIRKQTTRRFIKAQWGDLRLLIPEEHLLQFSERAAGLYVPEIENYYDLYFWIDGVQPDRLTGLPKYPVGFEKFLRRPITAKILRVLSSKRIPADESEHNAESVVRRVLLSTGSANGVRKGMKFDIGETRDQLVIESVTANSSIAISERLIIEGKESCSDFGLDFRCPAIVSGTRIRTRVADFFKFG